MFNPDEGESAAARRLADPAATPSELAAIVTAFPALAPRVAAHPAAQQGPLRAWLAALHSPEVDAVLNPQTAFAHDAARPLVPPQPSPPSPGIPPPGAAPGFAPPGFAPPGSAPRRADRPRRKKRLLIGLAAAVGTAALVVVGTVWRLGPNHDGRDQGARVPIASLRPTGRVRNQDEPELKVPEQEAEEAAEGPWSQPLFAPDVAQRPDHAAQLGSRTILDGEFMRTDFGDPLDAETGLAMGYTPVQSEDQAGRGAAAIAAFDLVTGERRWQVDLLQAAGLSGDLAPVGLDAFPDGTGDVLADICIDGLNYAYVAIDSQGQVISTTRTSGRLMEVKGGIAFAWDSADVTARSLTDLGVEVWRARSAGSEGQVEPLVNQASGTFWVPTEDGFVDALTGKALGFGADAGEPEISYAMPAAGPEPIVIRLDREAVRVARIDPTDGATQWQVEVPSQRHLSQSFFATGMVLVEVTDGLTPDTTRAIDLVEGTVVWASLTGGIVGNWVGHRPITVSEVILVSGPYGEGDLTAIDPATGEVAFVVPCPDDCRFGTQGRQVAYLIQDWADGSAHVRAVSLTDGADLWTLELSLAQTSDFGPALKFSRTHLWLEMICGQDDTVYEVMQLIA
ncbi:MAG: PQQ-binding-like beta-propeller repeat protein [Bifidobacteriaceae bacterium]|jgi:outer membrane protein assembly factor BamB|nr:PQQ-binding-like beta-propeller repeat protein [Bifidobacteriaceae bacterium]